LSLIKNFSIRSSPTDFSCFSLCSRNAGLFFRACDLILIVGRSRCSRFLGFPLCESIFGDETSISAVSMTRLDLTEIGEKRCRWLSGNSEIVDRCGEKRDSGVWKGVLCETFYFIISFEISNRNSTFCVN